MHSNNQFQRIRIGQIDPNCFPNTDLDIPHAEDLVPVGRTIPTEQGRCDVRHGCQCLRGRPNEGTEVHELVHIWGA